MTAPAPSAPAPALEPWTILVVDDDAEVHAVTRLALSDAHFAGRSLDVLSANSGAEARRILQARPEIALVLLDVVMETEHAGLELVRYIRDTLGNKLVRLVLRTGQPGQAPAREVVAQYEIDDYRSKTELTFERLNSLVTAALRTHQLLRQLEQDRRLLQSSNQELERFAYIASHDLQAPLRGIVGFAQLLERRYGDKLDAQGRELLSFIAAGGRQLQALISDLLAFSRVGRNDVAIELVDLDALVRRAFAKLQPALAGRSPVLECSGLPRLRGNGTQLEQLFQNLIDNALKFQPGDQPVVSVSGRRAGAGWEIRVVDRGIGIRGEFLHQIFEIFRRLHTEEQYPGTGIGLAICKKVVEFHGGTIHAESRPGAGTTIVIHLPDG